MRRAGEYLGVGIANLINVFNPELIILGGQIRPSRQRVHEAHCGMRRVLAEVGSSVTAVLPSLDVTQAWSAQVPWCGRRYSGPLPSQSSRGYMMLFQRLSLDVGVIRVG